MRAFEDFTIGETIEHGACVVTAEEIVSFAREFDPQPFHLDQDSPEAALTGGLIASGWHVAGLFMRLMADSMLLDSTCMGSPGIDVLKWLKPVRPGDTITYVNEVVGKRPSRSMPQWGLVSFKTTGRNQDGEMVVDFTGHVFIERRDKSPPEDAG